MLHGGAFHAQRQQIVHLHRWPGAVLSRRLAPAGPLHRHLRLHSPHVSQADAPKATAQERCARRASLD